MHNLLKLFQDSSALYGSNASFIEELYEKYLENPDSVEKSWQSKFSKIGNGNLHDIPHGPVVERFAQLAIASQGRLAQLQGFTEESVKKQSAVARLINHYRVRGHQLANNNPLGKPEMSTPDLEPSYYGLTALDMDTLFDTGTLYGVDRLTLRKIISILKEIYCKRITIQSKAKDTTYSNWRD